jgi:hypothetical protein
MLTFSRGSDRNTFQVDDSKNGMTKNPSLNLLQTQ